MWVLQGKFRTSHNLIHSHWMNFNWIANLHKVLHKELGRVTVLGKKSLKCLWLKTHRLKADYWGMVDHCLAPHPTPIPACQWTPAGSRIDDVSDSMLSDFHSSIFHFMSYYKPSRLSIAKIKIAEEIFLN